MDFWTTIGMMCLDSATIATGHFSGYIFSLRDRSDPKCITRDLKNLRSFINDPMYGLTLNRGDLFELNFFLNRLERGGAFGSTDYFDKISTAAHSATGLNAAQRLGLRKDFKATIGLACIDTDFKERISRAAVNFMPEAAVSAELEKFPALSKFGSGAMPPDHLTWLVKLFSDTDVLEAMKKIHQAGWVFRYFTPSPPTGYCGYSATPSDQYCHCDTFLHQELLKLFTSPTASDQANFKTLLIETTTRYSSEDLQRFSDVLIEVIALRNDNNS